MHKKTKNWAGGAAVVVIVVAAIFWLNTDKREPVNVRIQSGVEVAAAQVPVSPKVVIMANGERGLVKASTPVMISWASSAEQCVLTNANGVYSVTGNGALRFNLRFNGTQDTTKYTFKLTCNIDGVPVSDTVMVGGFTQ